MHELSLMAQVPASRHAQLLQILVGLAAMQPHRVIERHMIFKPKRTPGQRVFQVGGSQDIQTQQSQTLQGQQSGELFYMQLVGEVDVGHFPRGVGQDGESSAIEAPGRGSSQGNDIQSYDFAHQPWSLRFADLPEVPGKRPVTSRMMSAVDISNGDALRFMDDFGYKYASVAAPLAK